MQRRNKESSCGPPRRSLRLVQREVVDAHCVIGNPVQRRRRLAGNWTWMDFNEPIWRKQFLDLGHCRFKKCTERLSKANKRQLQELINLRITFMAMAITAAASSSGTQSRRIHHSNDTNDSRSTTNNPEDILLIRYCEVLLSLDMDPNDTYKGSSAVVLAALHGFVGVLSTMLAAGSSLRGEGNNNNSGAKVTRAVMAAVRSGNHACLELMVKERKEEVTTLLMNDSLSTERVSTLYSAIMKGDITSVRWLRNHGNAMLSDFDARFLYNNVSRQGRLQSILLELNTNNDHEQNPIAHHSWSKLIHWSFPTTDRQTLNYLWHIMVKKQHSYDSSCYLPEEMWLRVFSFMGRGWFGKSG